MIYCTGRSGTGSAEAGRTKERDEHGDEDGDEDDGEEEGGMKISGDGLQRKIGGAVARARKRRGLTQQALARVMKTRQANISRVERGMQNLSLDLLVRLDEALGLDLKISVR